MDLHGNPGSPGSSQAPRSFHFVQLDVFSRRALAGNQLAVFLDARGLSDEQMQALARETNLCETTFIVPREEEIERERGVQVRIFTVAEELKFAGHPTLGTALVLRGQFPERFKNQVILDLKVGKIPVTFEEQAEGLVFGEMRQPDPEFGAVHSREKIAAALGLNLAGIAADVPVQTVSTGMPFAILPIVSLATLQNIDFSWSQAANYLAGTDAKFIYLVTRETTSPAVRLHARMIFYNGEDPATGSAAGCAAAWMVQYGIAAPGEQVQIEQGLEMKRPSQIFVRADASDENNGGSAPQRRVTSVRVGGYAVSVMRGHYNL